MVVAGCGGVQLLGQYPAMLGINEFIKWRKNCKRYIAELK